MKRAYFQSRFGRAALIVALIWSLAPGATFSKHVPANSGNRITLARTAEVKVTAGAAGVLIEWRTSFELDNLGFNIYRADSGVRTQVNPALIAGSAMIVEQGTPLYAGYSYRWFDTNGKVDSRYYLEDVDIKDSNTVTGPYAPVWNEGVAKGPQARLMSEVAAQSAGIEETGGPTGTLDGFPGPSPVLPAQWDIAAQPGLKIGINQNGWYRVTQPQMVATGFSVSGDAANLRLFADGNEIPIEVSRASGTLGPTDFIEFYGTGLNTLTTDTRVYYLLNGTQPGLRVPLFGEIQADALPTPAPRSSPFLPPDNANSAITFWPNGISGGIDGQRADRKEAPEIVRPAAENLLLIREGEANIPPSVNKDEVSSSNATPTSPPRTPATAEINHPPRLAANKARALTTNTHRISATRTKHRRRSYKRRGHSLKPARRRHHAVLTASTSAGFLYDVQHKERFVYFSSLLNGDAENYFGGSLIAGPYTPQNPPTVKTLTLTNLQTDSQATAFLRVGLQGTTIQSHLVNVFVNDVMVGSVAYDFQAYGEQTFSLPVSQLREGANDIRFEIAGGIGDHSLFSYARLTYPRLLRASGDTLSFAARATQNATIDGFTTPNIRVLDITNPFSVQEVRPGIQTSSFGYAAIVPASTTQTKGSRRFLALPNGSFQQPASLLFNQPSTLNLAGTANAADLLVIAHKSFIPSLNSVLPGTSMSFVDQRHNQGYTVKIVDIEDVFDEFSYGTHTPQAIKDFLARASTPGANWTQAPKYVLFVGDASYDARNYEGVGNFDFVPTKLIDTTYMETASDDTLADFDGDGVPEIPVGRLPVRTVAEENLMLTKIVNFLPSNVPQNALMVADTQGSYFFDFENANDQLGALVPPGMPVQKVYRRLEPSDAAARADIISKINAGTALVNYSGHGNVDVWTGAPIFSASDAAGLTNGAKLPLVIVMDCLNGYFMSPPIDCLSEALMKAPNGGAIATFSSSGLTEPTGQHQMGQKLFQLLYSGPPIALGDATRQAKAATTDFDVQRTWILLGDPTMKIR
jgi:hypothetical protein